MSESFCRHMRRHQECKECENMWSGVFPKLPLNSFGFPNDNPDFVNKKELIKEL